MSTQLDVFIFGLVYVVISLVFGTFTLYLFLRVFSALTRDIDDFEEIKKNNIAVALVSSAIIVSVALFVGEAVGAAMEAFKNNIFGYTGTASLMFKVKTYIIMFIHFVLSVLISFFVLWLSMTVFTLLTRKIDEFAEIKKNNQAVGIVLAAFILSMALILKPGVGRLLKGIIPFPEVSNSPRAALILEMNSFRSPDSVITSDQKPLGS